MRVLNSTSETQVINRNIYSFQNLSEYNIFKADYVDKTNSERNKALIDILREKIPIQARDAMLDLCVEFSDIFALETDRMTINNFYEQKLQVDDKAPVFSKNYRLPYTQK